MDYENEMKRCIELAKAARGQTSPNPMVGCIVLNSEGKIISEGYHKAYGEFHAERDALLKLDSAKDCTLIVNLEPCCHTGKTPPCTDIIIEKGIKKVVYGMKDPNPKVAGKGLKILKDANIKLIGPVLEKECRELNEVFVKNHTLQKTFVALKVATTIDGKIATSTKDSKWITSESARKKGKELRTYYDAILTSSSTIIADNPTMKHKRKIVLDRELKTDLNSNIYKQGEIFVFYDKNIKNSEIIIKNRNTNINYIPAPVKQNKLDIEFILNKLYNLGIMSVFVEAGGRMNASFLPYIDKLYHFIAPKVLSDNSGKSCFDGKSVQKIAECTNLSIINIEKYQPDILITYKFNC